MTREELIAIAKKQALLEGRADGAHDYLPRTVESLFTWEPHAWVVNAMEAALRAQGHVVVTKNEAGEIVSVTRQDDEGRVLSVIAEAAVKE